MDILKNKKAQLQIQETILVVFIFIVLILFGMVLFYKIQEKSIDNDFRSFELDKTKLKFITLASMPEFSCTEFGIRQNCVDVSKLLVVKDLSKNNDYYFSKFGYSSITVFKIYPENSSVECKGISDNCGVWNVYSKKPSKYDNKAVIEAPVSLYDSFNDVYYIGKIVVEEYN